MNPPHRILRRLIPKSWYRAINDSYNRRLAATHTDPEMAEQALGAVDAYWRGRIDLVKACGDNAAIPRHPQAGLLQDGWITMHNGLLVGAMGYYGGGILNMLVENKGVHEPQEERAYLEVLPHVAPGSTILELGAYWAFYSMWFAREVPDASCFLVEPDSGNIESGRKNFERNGFNGTFEQAYVGGKPGFHKDGVPIITVDGFCERHNIGHLAILHADIQEAERDMLDGARHMLGGQHVDYVFISTHNNDLHYACMARLGELGYHIMASCDHENSCEGDGVIVAKRHGIRLPESLSIENNSIR
jgi:hypothetical protein